MRSGNDKEIKTYGQLLTGVMFDKKLSRDEKFFFCYCHTLKGDKDFRINPNLIRKVNRKEAAKVLEVNEKTITRWTNKLEARGWISIRYQGCKGYIITLHVKRKRRKNAKNGF